MSKPKTVLIIEDNLGDQILLQESLKSTNLTIERISMAGSMSEAKRLLQEHTYSIIFLDLFLPDSVGLDTFQQLLSNYSDIPVIISSGLADTKVAIKAISMGAQDFLIKGDYNTVMLEKAFRYAIGRKEAERIIKTSEEEYRNLFDNNPAVIFVWDNGGFQILNVNATAVRLFGYTKNEFTKKTLLDLCPENDKDKLNSIGKKPIPGYKKTSGVCQYFKSNGESIYLDISSHPILYQGKDAMLSLAIDITEKVLLKEKLAEEKIKKQLDITAAVITAQGQERTFLGEELHDNINQILATANLYLDCVLSDAVPRVNLIRDSKGLIKNAIEEIRKLSKTLLPPKLGEGGLIEAINDIIGNITHVNDDVKFSTDWQLDDENVLSDKLKLTIFRIVQEQLNNIFKHAHASHISISLQQQDQTLRLIIQDNGIGFDVSEKRSGIGLQNIFSRASLVNGIATITSSPGEGCELMVIFETGAP